MTALSKYRFTGYPTLPGADLNNLPPVTTKPSNDSLKDWILFYLEKFTSPSLETISAKKQDLQKFLNYFLRHNPDGLLSNWDKALTYGFMEKLKEVYETASVRRMMATLLTFSVFLERHRVFEYSDNPGRVKIPPKKSSAPKSLVFTRKKKIVLEGEAVFNLLIKTAKNAIKEKKLRAYRDLAILLTLYYGALRVSELCGLKMSQMEKDYDTGGIVFRKARGKGQKERDVYTGSACAAAIDNYIEKERGNKQGPVFLAYPSLQKGKKTRLKAITRGGVWRILKRIAKKAEVTLEGTGDLPLHPHRLRHERAYRLKAAGYSDSDIADELGHSGTGYVGVYTKRSEKARFERLSKVR